MSISRCRPGEIRAVIGPNGAGKTTFVSLICGRIPPTSGEIRFDGQTSPTCRAISGSRKGIAYTFQITSVFANLDRLRQCRAAGAARAVRPAAGRASCATASCRRLRAPGWRTAPGKPAGTLSYGHQRLLEVAMGLALKPRLLILDEPTQGLSDGEIERFHRTGARDRARRHRPADRAQHAGGHGSWPTASPC